MKARFPLCLAMLMALTLALPACMGGSSTVRLTYPDQLGDFPWCRWSVTVVGFEDNRQDVKTLGRMDDDNVYLAGSNTADWVTRAFFEELESRGCDCVYKDDASQATTDYVITGEIYDVSLDKTGFTDWNTHLRMLVSLEKNGERVYAETYTGEMDRTFVITTDAPETLLGESLQYVVSDAVAKLIDHMKAAE